MDLKCQTCHVGKIGVEVALTRLQRRLTAALFYKQNFVHRL